MIRSKVEGKRFVAIHNKRNVITYADELYSELHVSQEISEYNVKIES